MIMKKNATKEQWTTISCYLYGSKESGVILKRTWKNVRKHHPQNQSILHIAARTVPQPHAKSTEKLVKSGLFVPEIWSETARYTIIINGV